MKPSLSGNIINKWGRFRMSVLIIGGSGYIGSHIVKQLEEQKRDFVVLDNLSTGHRLSISEDVNFYEGDIRDSAVLREIFEKEAIDVIVHLAAFSIVSESVSDPLKYFDNNTFGMINLLKEMKNYNIKKIVFSSTAATYGVPDKIPIFEDDNQAPINPYGESKLMMEKIVRWADTSYGIKFIILRYFNVAGAYIDGSIGEDHKNETHLIPNILKTALGKNKELKVYGDSYNTKDGTNIRDYIHVLDLSDAHILAIEYLRNDNDSNAFNLGSSTGFSVLEMISKAKKVTGEDIPYQIVDNRPGDPDSLVSSSDKARTILNWTPKYDNLETIIQTAWLWTKNHPDGYDDFIEY